MSDVCRHGGLRRQCETCDVEAQRDILAAALREYADHTNWGRAPTSRFMDAWQPSLNGYTTAEVALHQAGMEESHTRRPCVDSVNSPDRNHPGYRCISQDPCIGDVCESCEFLRSNGNRGREAELIRQRDILAKALRYYVRAVYPPSHGQHVDSEPADCCVVSPTIAMAALREAGIEEGGDA